MGRLLAFLRTLSLAKKVEQCQTIPKNIAARLLPAKLHTRFQKFREKARPQAHECYEAQPSDAELSNTFLEQSPKEKERKPCSDKALPTDAADLPAEIDELEQNSSADQASHLTSSFPASERPVTVQDDEEDPERLIWDTVRDIEDSMLINLARVHLGARYGDSCKVIERKEGSYNRVHVIQFGEDKGFRCVVRVPACGRPGVWQPEDAVIHRSQALTINYIKRHTHLPLPEVLAYDHTCNNAFGHPFTIETFLEGRQLLEVWNEELSPDREIKRLRILRSLATTMKDFDQFSFDAAGTLYYEHDLDDNPKVGPKYAIHELVERFPRFIPSYNNTHGHFEGLLNAWWDDLPKSTSDSIHYTMRGAFKMMKLVIECIPHDLNDSEESNVENDFVEEADGGDKNCKEQVNSHEEPKNVQQEQLLQKDNLSGNVIAEDSPVPETFVLAPPDFNWQNILIDEDCKITGLLDWDRVATVPRLLGFAKTPLWLNSDWLFGYHWSGQEGEADHDLERYRKAYASYMAEAMGERGDCIYTGKSHLFDSLGLALEDCQQTRHYVSGWLRAILPRSDPHGYLERIGNPDMGFEEGEADWMRERLGKLFACFAGTDERFSF